MGAHDRYMKLRKPMWYDSGLIESLRELGILHFRCRKEFKDKFLRANAWRGICFKSRVKVFVGNEFFAKGNGKIPSNFTGSIYKSETVSYYISISSLHLFWSIFLVWESFRSRNELCVCFFWITILSQLSGLAEPKARVYDFHWTPPWLYEQCQETLLNTLNVNVSALMNNHVGHHIMTLSVWIQLYHQ